jgi:fucose 4-O-acetylase-like acetyltransferase
MMTSKRIAWFDNSKGILIFLVVLGHLLEVYRHYDENTVVLWLYNTIYTFHMPLFILISGYFFREGRFRKVLELFSVFLVWQLIDGVLGPLIKTHHLPDLTHGGRLFKLLDPQWTLWYLIGIVVWRAITPYVLKLRYPIVMAILVAIWASFVPDLTHAFSLRKLLNFYPFYLIGYTLGQKGTLMALLEKAKTKGRLLQAGAGIFVLGFLAFMYYFTSHNFNTDLLFMSYSYDHFGWSFYKGVVFSILFYGAVTTLCLAILTLVPKERKLFLFSKLGTYSLYIYLLHANIVRVFRKVVPDWLTHDPLVLILVALGLALAISILTTSAPVLRLFRPLMEPKLNWIVNAKEKNKEIKSKGQVRYGTANISNQSS